MATEDSPPTDLRVPAWLYALVALVCCGVILTGILTKFFVYYVWDDAYMFIRYADNLLQHGTVSWNPQSGPVYGLTSPLFLTVVVPFRLIFPTQPALAAASSSLFCTVLFITGMFFLVRHWIQAPYRRPAVMLLLITLAVGGRHISALAMSGMDTTFALCWCVLYIHMAMRFRQAGTARAGVVLGVAGGLAFFVRPDLLVFSCAVPGTIILLTRESPIRGKAVIALLVTVTLLVVQLLAAHMYFGSMLPLPFYAKSSGLYGDFIHSMYRNTPYKQLKDFVYCYAPAFMATAIALVATGPGLWRWMRQQPQHVGLLAGAVLLVVYYFFFVLQIMPFNGRFYHPALPALLFVGCAGLPVAMRGFRREAGRYTSWMAIALALAGLAGSVVGATDTVGAIRTDIKMNNREHNFARFDVLDMYRKFEGDRFLFGLDKICSLPEDAVVATTEVGLLGVLNANKTVVDMAGLNETRFAFRNFSADTLFAVYNPDVIYMPHPHYTAMVSSIETHPYFLQHYRYYTGIELRALMGIAVRRDSRYAGLLEKIITDKQSTIIKH